MKSYENSDYFENAPDLDPETIRFLTQDIDLMTLDHELDILVNESLKGEPMVPHGLDPEGLKDAAADLTDSNIKDIREFERREGIKEGLLLAKRKLERRLDQATPSD